MTTHSRTLPRHTTLRAYAARADWNRFRSAVSLHAHTSHSREMLSDLPNYIAKIPILSRWFEREGAMQIDFSKGHWQPPADAREVFESEVSQIDRAFSLRSIVSVTDHDNIDACLELQEEYAASRAPISTEWTVPYGHGFFHLGVHNLPSAAPRIWFERLAAFTARPAAEPLADILADLYDEPATLIVFNHPLWDLAGVGHASHQIVLRRFLSEHGHRLHALEINGYRSRAENGGVRRLAAETNVPLISGGDRHALAPNAVVNLTSARTFAEFAEEIRGGLSHIVVMPEYGRHIGERVMAATADVLRHYRDHAAGRHRWMDRVWWESGDGVRPVSHHWPDGGPLWVRTSLAAFRIISSRAMLPVVRAVLSQFEAGPAVGPVPVAAERL